MRGDLNQVLVPELLMQLFLNRRSGVLRLQRQEEKKNIYIMDGEIVFAHSNQKQDRLGETLLRLGKVTQEEFENASREVIERGKRLGQALEDLGVLSAVEVNSGVRYQLQQVVFSVFDWDTGSYNFLDRERPVYEDIMVDISTANLILEGIRHMQTPSLPARSFGNDENCILRPNDAAGRIPRREFDFAEETILACVDGKKDVAALRNLTRLSVMEFDRAACSLILSGILLAAGRTDLPDAEPQEEDELEEIEIREEVRKRWAITTDQDEKPRPSGMNNYTEDEMRQMILDTEAKLHGSAHEEILNVFPDSTKKEIQRSYDHLTGLFHPLYYSQKRFLDLKPRLKFILDKLAEAHDHLLHRADSLMPLDDIPLSQAEEGDFPLVKEDEMSLDSQDLYNEIHPMTPSDELSQMQEPAVVEEPFIPAESPEIETYEKMENYTDLPQVEEQQEPSSPEYDVEDLQKKLKLDPANAELLRSLGFGLLDSGKAVEAEKHLIRALEIEPQNVANHFALAQLYQSQGLRMKAFKHLNVVLQLEPENEKAREMLGLEKRRKPLYEISSKTKKAE